MAADVVNEPILKLLRTVYKADKTLVDIRGLSPLGRLATASLQFMSKNTDARILDSWLFSN